MKVAIESDLLSHSSLTGVEKYLYHLIHSLSMFGGLDLTLLCHRQIPEESLPGNINVINENFNAASGGKYFLSKIKRAKELCQYDIVHTPTVIVPFFYRRNKKPKLLMTVHDLFPALFPELSTIKKSIYYRDGLKLLFKCVDHFIVPSKSVRQGLLEYNAVRSERITVIHEGVSEKYKPKCGPKQDYLLAVSTIEPRKNFRRLIESFLFLKREYRIPTKLVIVGKRGWRCDDIFCVPDEFKDSIIFKGYISDEELIALYQRAKLFIYPSLHEGFGLPVLESMACGCPVITSNLSSLPEVVGDAGILVNPHDTGEIARAIICVLQNENLTLNLIEKGLKQAKKFTWSRCAKETLNLYEMVSRK